MPDEKPPIVCEHDARCATCRTCTECYPHEPGTWVASGITEPCRSAAIMKHLNDLETMEEMVGEIAEQTEDPAAAGKAGSLLDTIHDDRDRILGTDEL